MTNTTSNKAYMYLVKLLSSRDYSEYKLREKLREKKYPADEIESALNEIKSKGFLREEAYAEKVPILPTEIEIDLICVCAFSGENL